jgi:cytochrome c peroxidase
VKVLELRRALLALLALASSACGEDLRTRIEAAGVFSPSRTDGGQVGVFELGQVLFFDRELSGNRNVACSSCHMPFHHAHDQLSLGIGQGGEGTGALRTGGPVLPRNTLSPFNRSFADSLFWDGRVELLADGTISAPVDVPEGVETLLEAQAILPLLDRDEMRGQQGQLDVWGATNELAAFPDDSPELVWEAIMVRLMAIEEYRVRFSFAFPDVPEGQHTIVHVARAIERFEMRLWELTDTQFDQFLGSEHRPAFDEALTESQRRGAELFFGDAGCDRCHNGPLLSDGEYHNIGVPPFGPGRRDGMDEGRFLVTGDPADRFAFRTPPLRNVELTGPYMHNGTFGRLDEAIHHHIDPTVALSATSSLPDGSSPDPAIAAEIRASIEDTRPLRALSGEDLFYLEDFLRSLTSATEISIFAGAGEPMAVPSRLPIDQSIH